MTFREVEKSNFFFLSRRTNQSRRVRGRRPAGVVATIRAGRRKGRSSIFLAFVPVALVSANKVFRNAVRAKSVQS